MGCIKSYYVISCLSYLGVPHELWTAHVARSIVKSQWVSRHPQQPMCSDCDGRTSVSKCTIHFPGHGTGEDWWRCSKTEDI